MSKTSRFIRKKAVLMLSVMTLSVVGAVPGCAGKLYAAENAVSSFEVHFLLDPEKALDAEHQLTMEAKELFAVTSAPRPIDVIYLETQERGFFQEGWINRLRLKEGKKKFERTAKKRYSVREKNQEGIQALLDQVAKEGFTISEDGFEAEVDWGYDAMTFSITAESESKHPTHTAIPEFTTEEAIAFFGEAMPDEEKNWKEPDWGTTLLQDAKIAGPVYVQRYLGTWEDLGELSIEVWPKGDPKLPETECICELSFKRDNFEAASADRDRMMDFLDQNGIMLHQDGLKTTQILDYYLGERPPVTEWSDTALDGTEYTFELRGGEACLKGVTSHAAELTVPAETTAPDGAVYPVSILGACAFRGTELKALTIGENIKKVEANALSGQTKLKKLVILAPCSKELFEKDALQNAGGKKGKGLTLFVRNKKDKKALKRMLPKLGARKAKVKLSK